MNISTLYDMKDEALTPELWAKRQDLRLIEPLHDSSILAIAGNGIPVVRTRFLIEEALWFIITSWGGGYLNKDDGLFEYNTIDSPPGFLMDHSFQTEEEAIACFHKFYKR